MLHNVRIAFFEDESSNTGSREEPWLRGALNLRGTHQSARPGQSGNPQVLTSEHDVMNP
jgi:hypothetical protein